MKHSNIVGGRQKVFGVYLHSINDNHVFYVGKGPEKRAFNFNDRGAWHKNVVAKHGRSNIMVSFLPCASEEESFSIEKELIKYFGRKNLSAGPLINLTDGGEGLSGYVATEERKKQLREQHLAWVNAHPKEYAEMQQRATEAKRVPQARLVAAKAKLAWHAAHPEESATYRAKTLATQQTDAHRAKVSKKMASWHAENPESSAAQQNTRRRVMQSTAYRAGRSLIAKQLTAQGRIGVRAGTKFPPSHCLSIGAAKDVWWAEHSDAKWMCKAGEKAVRVVQEKQPTLLLSGWTYGMKVKGN